MRKIILENYMVDVGGNPTPYDVKGTIITCMFHPSLGLSGRELLNRYYLSEKIESAGNSVLLENSEYAIIESAFEKVKGFSQNDVELVKRVLEAEIVEIKEVE